MSEDTIVVIETVTETVEVTEEPTTVVISTVGAQGIQGETGEGVPTGGAAGEVLTKQSGTDFDTDWEVPTADADNITFAPTGGVASTDVQAAIAELDSEKATPAQIAAAIAALAAVYQPLDSDLTAIAALLTTAFGRSILTLANAAAAQALFDLEPGTDIPSLVAFNNHHARHEEGGADEVSVTVGQIDDEGADFGQVPVSDGAGVVSWQDQSGAGGGAPSTADFLVGTAQPGLSSEIVVGTTPGGELGGTWGSPTVDAVHSGSSHASIAAAAQAALDAHLADTADAHDGSAISYDGTGQVVTVATDDVQEAVEALDAGLTAHIVDAVGAHDAAAISFTPSGTIAADNVDDALQELDTEKAAAANVVMDGDAAGGVLSGTYPSPGFAVDMATQAELDAAIATRQPLDSDLTAIAALADPNADRILFWDDSLGAYTFLSPGTGLTITGTTIDASASGGAATTYSVAQTGHGLAVGDVVRHNGTNYVKAQADSATNAEVIGIVSAVADADHFTLLTEGQITGLSGLTAGTAHFLSATSAGALTATEPSTAGQVSKPVLVAYSTTAGVFVNLRGAVIATQSAGGVLDGTYPNPGLAASVAGSGLAETADVLSVNVDDSTLQISSDTLRVKDAGITAAKLATGPAGSVHLLNYLTSR